MDGRVPLGVGPQRGEFGAYLASLRDACVRSNAAIRQVKDVLGLPGSLTDKWPHLLELLSSLTTDLNTCRDLLSSSSSSATPAAARTAPMALLQPQATAFSPLWTTTAELVELVQERAALLGLYHAADAAAAASGLGPDAPAPAYPPTAAERAALLAASPAAAVGSDGTATDAGSGAGAEGGLDADADETSAAIIAGAVEEAHARLNSFNDLVSELRAGLVAAASEGRVSDAVVPTVYVEWLQLAGAATAAAAAGASAGAGAGGSAGMGGEADLLAALRALHTGAGLR